MNTTTSATVSEFDRVFAELEHPDYPATCVECGAEGTNESLAAHECAVVPRPGERVQTWWCEGCEEWHTGSVLGGAVGETGEERNENT